MNEVGKADSVESFVMLDGPVCEANLPRRTGCVFTILAYEHTRHVQQNFPRGFSVSSACVVSPSITRKTLLSQCTRERLPDRVFFFCTVTWLEKSRLCRLFFHVRSC